MNCSRMPQRHGAKNFHGVGRIRWIEKLQRPFGHALARVVMSQSAREIGEVLIGIAERIRSRILFERILRHGVLEMLQRHGAFEAQFGRGPLKSGNGDGVIERIVQPAQVSGLRRDDQVGPDQPQVVPSVPILMRQFSRS